MEKATTYNGDLGKVKEGWADKRNEAEKKDVTKTKQIKTKQI